MTDLSKTIAPKSDQLNSDDLISGPMTIRITRVTACPDSAEQPIAIYFEGDGGKPYKPCKSMRRVLVHVWGKDGATFAGRSMTLYRDADVLFGGLKVGGIRISHMSDIPESVTMALTATRANRKAFTVKPLAVAVDKVAEGVRALIHRIGAGALSDTLHAIVAEPAVVKQRAWLAKNRPDLAAEVDAAVELARGHGVDDRDPFADAPDAEPITLQVAKDEVMLAVDDVDEINRRVSKRLPHLTSDEDRDALMAFGNERIAAAAR